MAALTRRLSHLRRKPPLPYRFSSSLPDPPSQPEPEPEPTHTPSHRPFSPNLTDIRASLHQQSPQTTHRPRLHSPPPPPPSKSASLDEIRRNLQEYRQRTSAPPPPSSDHQPVRFQQIYKNAVANAAASRNSLDDIRQSLRPSLNNSGLSPSVERFKESLNRRPDPSAALGPSPAMVIGGSEDDAGELSRTGLIKMYDHVELGRKLKMLRPQKRDGKWFSFGELNERLAMLQTIEEKESEGIYGGVFKDIKASIRNLATVNYEKERQKTKQKLAIIGALGGTPSFMLKPPKEHLVEKFFHPDNMSSAEKLKLELKRVRDEFKMSESDCGSARVQVAQLTTKIKHLSTVLQKKDKHSRKGLQAMVQRRKKLLKYLRRTDWDSYCLVLSKLGLRDNPDMKA